MHLGYVNGVGANYQPLLKRQRSLSVEVEKTICKLSQIVVYFLVIRLEMVRMLTQNQVTIETIVILIKHPFPLRRIFVDLPIAQILNPLLDRIDYAGSFFKPNEKSSTSC